MIWVFAYGSLMWNPGFEYHEKKIGKIKDYRRTFSLKATEHRGTPINPGLVLTLKKELNSECVGVCFGIKKENWFQVEKYLIDREFRGEIKPYIFIEEEVEFECMKKVKAITLLTEEHNELFVKDLTSIEKAKIILKARGDSGTNLEYYLNTVNFLKKIGIYQDKIFEIENQIKKIKKA